MIGGKEACEKTHRYHQIVLGHGSRCWIDLLKVARHLCTEIGGYGALSVILAASINAESLRVIFKSRKRGKLGKKRGNADA